MAFPAISIIGLGAVGRTMALSLHACNFPIKSLFNRHPAKAKELAHRLGIDETGTFPDDKQQLGEVLFLGVPDNAIHETATRIAELHVDFEGTVAAHFSGAENSGLLAPLRDKGASVAAFHPLQTFHAGSDPGIIRGIFFSIEGQPTAANLLQEIANKLEARTIAVEKDAKPYLHAAAVIACNYLLSLMHAAGKTAALGGIGEDRAREALMPLVRQTLENASAGELSKMLSGPIARGDIGTIEKHLSLLEHNSDLSSLYKSVGLYTLELAEENDRLDENQLRQLKKLFNL